MSDKTQLVARQVVEVIPQVMRTLALEIRSTGHLPLPAHCPLLVILAERPHNLSELAEKHAVSLPTMSNSISRLVERGLVTRVRAPHDRRVVRVELTTAGKAALELMRRSVEERLARSLVNLSPEQCDEVLAGLEALAACFGPVAETRQGPTG